MIKKKSELKEETKDRQENEPSENKDNIESIETIGQTVKEESEKIETPEQTPETKEPEAPAADKVVSAEKLLEEKLAEMQDKYVRLAAEFDNYRKRTLKEKMELSKYASENLLLQILPFMDDFERALENIENTTDCVAIKEGIDLIHTKFCDFLKQNGITEVEALNCPFNVDLHDAVAKVAVEEEDKKGKVIKVIQKGYFLLDKVIRHSKVIVGE